MFGKCSAFGVFGRLLGHLSVHAAVAKDVSDAARGPIPAPPLQRLVHERPAQPVPLHRVEVGRRRRREQPTQVPKEEKSLNKLQRNTVSLTLLIRRQTKISNCCSLGSLLQSDYAGCDLRK